MKIQFLGTGAADWPLEPHDDAFFRGTCSTLFQENILVDVGYTAIGNLTRANADIDKIHSIVITHRHSDHFDLGNLAELSSMHSRPDTITIYAGSSALSELRAAGLPFRLQEVTAGKNFPVGDCEFTAIRANHMLSDFSTEEAFNYLICCSGKNLLYALDTSWLNKSTWLSLHGKYLSMMVWDCTIGPKNGDWRIFEHCSLSMIELMVQSLKAAGIVDNKTWMVMNHIALTLWPDQKTTEEIIKSYGYIHAFDGLELEI